MKPAPSPLFEPVLWGGGGFRILDEILLPERVAYIEVTDVAAALDAVKAMKTRAFGQVLTFLYSGALLALQYRGDAPEPLREKIARLTEQFSAARPTFDFQGLGSFFPEWFAAQPAGSKVGEWIASQARRLAAEIINARRGRAKRAASILPGPARLLTHCNISGELVAIAQACQELDKPCSVIATETRPYLQGTRLTAWELSRAGVAVSVIPDGAVAQVMARGEVNAVVVGADRCARNGDVINKIGTYTLALSAKQWGIPFYALVQPPGSLARGADLVIEERPADELLYFRGRPLLEKDAARVAVRYPAFDVTPAALVTNLIGFDGVFTPESFRERFFTDDAAAPEPRHRRGEKYGLVHGLPGEQGYRVLAAAVKAKQVERILVPEMRPELRGARVVARELARREIPTTFISDNMMGALFAQGQIEKLFLFHGGLSEQGPSAYCGGLLAAQLARAHGVAIELEASRMPADSAIDRDVGTFLGEKVIPAGVVVHPLEREIIPWEWCGGREGNGS